MLPTFLVGHLRKSWLLKGPCPPAAFTAPTSSCPHPQSTTNTTGRYWHQEPGSVHIYKLQLVIAGGMPTGITMTYIGGGRGWCIVFGIITMGGFLLFHPTLPMINSNSMHSHNLSLKQFSSNSISKPATLAIF